MIRSTAAPHAPGNRPMQTTPAEQRPKAKSSTPLLSHSTILILSAFLIGVAAGKAPDPQIEIYLYLTGFSGLVAYFGLGHIARRRKERTERRKQEKAAHRFEMRVSRHVPRPSRSPDHGQAEPSVDADPQYLPVVRSQ